MPETVVQQAGDAAIVTAQYLQASLTISLNKHYKDSPLKVFGCQGNNENIQPNGDYSS